MKKSITGAVLSGFIFPGMGQVVLGKKIAGVVLILVTNIGIAGLILSIVKRVPLIMEKIQPELENGAIGFDRMVELGLRYASLGSGSPLEKISLLLIAGCWIIAVGHAYYLGMKQGQEA